jgi:hypothetical protein
MTNSRHRDELLDKMHALLPRKFSNQVVGVRDVWFVAKLIQSEDQAGGVLRTSSTPPTLN